MNQEIPKSRCLSKGDWTGIQAKPFGFQAPTIFQNLGIFHINITGEDKLRELKDVIDFTLGDAPENKASAVFTPSAVESEITDNNLELYAENVKLKAQLEQALNEIHDLKKIIGDGVE